MFRILTVSLSILIVALTACTQNETINFSGERDNWSINYEAVSNDENIDEGLFIINYIGEEEYPKSNISYEFDQGIGHMDRNSPLVDGHLKVTGPVCSNCSTEDIAAIITADDDESEIINLEQVD